MTIRTWIAACGVTFCLLTPHAAAGPLEDANAAIARRDAATALNQYRPLARDGNVAAQFNPGLMYDKGEGVPQDYAEALKWYRLAAKHGHTSARYNLGVIIGEGVPQECWIEGDCWAERRAG